MENGKKSFHWQTYLIVVGMIFTGMASYTTVRVSIAEDLGDRPTRAEVDKHVGEIKHTIETRIKEIREQQKLDAQGYRDQQKEIRQDIRDLSQAIRESSRPR